MFGRSSFGAQPTSFGFGTNTSTAFGQSNQLFGNNPGGFGTTTSGFGAATQPMFGSAQQTSAPLFGSTNTSTFGQPNQTGFGSTLFGNAAQPSSSGIFGTSSTSSFGQQTKPNGFGFGTTSGTGGLFSQNSQQTPQNASVFQNSSTGGMFGTTNTFGQNTSQMGTVVKFVPVTGTDSIQKSGIAQSINTKHYCITFMKEYESKSLEELRWEDYQCNRKGSQQQGGFGAAQPFGITSTSSSIFGQGDNKPTFGSPRTDFGTQNAFGMSTQTTTQNSFAKPSTGFGTTSTNSFGFGTNTASTGLFGSNTTAKPFAAPTTQLFQAPQQQQQNGFGNVFGQPNAQNSSGMFGKPAQNNGFSAPQTGFSFPQQNQNNLFQTSKSNTGFGIFGQTTTQTNSFGQQQAQPSFGGFGTSFGKPAQPTFGNNTQPTFGNQQGNLFGNTQNKPLFGNTSGGTLFNNNSFQQNTSFQFPTQQQQPVMLQSMDSISQDLRSLVQITDPYGYNKHLEGLSPIKPSNAAYVTNPKDLQKLLESPPPMAVVSPMNKRLKVLPISAKKTNLFDEMLDKETTEINFSLRSSAKRLVLQKELRIGQGDDMANGDLSSVSEVSDAVDKEPKYQSPTMIPRLNLSTLQDDYSSSEPSLGQRDSVISLMTLSSNHSKGDISYPGDTSTNGTQYTGEQTPENGTARDRGDDIIAEVSKMDTCGVILTRPEYYTVPPLDKLIEHKNGDGKCLVKGFTIGRVGYGSLSFPDLMDVANLNLDELVHFRYREVTVYPDDTKKPPQGQGLNRRAQVTLDRVFPKAKIDRKLITDVETLMAINFSDTLRDLCEKHGTKFLDYRPETGSWVFMVEHFSKYGFSDSDDEESTAQLELKQKLLEQKVKDEHERRLQEECRKKREQKLRKERKFITDELWAEPKLHKGDFITTNDPIIANRFALMPEDLLLDDEMIEENSLCTLGASIETIDFDFDNTSPLHPMHHIKARTNLYNRRADVLMLMKAEMYEGRKFKPIQIKNTKLHPILWSMKDLPNRAPLPPPKKQHICHPVKIKPKKFKILNVTYAITIDQSLYTNRNYMDIGDFKGRSFKVGWGRGMFLTTKIVPKPPAPVQLLELTERSISAIAITDASPFMDFEPFKDRLEKHLQVVLDTADVTMQNTNIPFLKPRPGKTALLRHQLMARETARDNIGNEQVNYYQEIWNLCAACWGPMSRPTNRRDLLSTWLEKAVEQTVEEELSQVEDSNNSQIYKKIFAYLTGHHITEAAVLAADEDLHNLSLLISQLNSSGNTKAITQRQLEQWQTSLVYDHVDPVLQKIYMLIAGQVVAAGAKDDVDPIINVCKDLDWQRCFAIMLWYIAPSTDTIARGLDLYRENFETDGYCSRPNPPYANRNDVYDLKYHLMLLHTGRGRPLEIVLHPETHAKRPTDFRLSWLLLQTLQALDVGIISSAAKIVLTTSFAQQLENYGLYKWAVFVLLFLEDPSLRRNYIMGVLHRNLPPGEDDRMIEDELVTEFCLPAEWLHTVKAYKTISLGMPWEAYKHFTFTEDWVISHDIAITDVIPQLLVNEQFDLVSYILRDIEPGSRSIITWPEEGGLILMFLDMYDKFQEKRRFSREEAMSIHSLLVKICAGVTSYPFRSDMQRAAIAEISKHCSIYSRILLDQMQVTHPGITATNTTQMEELIMPPDYKIDDIYSEMNVFYEEPLML